MIDLVWSDHAIISDSFWYMRLQPLSSWRNVIPQDQSFGQRPQHKEIWPHKLQEMLKSRYTKKRYLVLSKLNN